jgi:hypothetical protein
MGVFVTIVTEPSHALPVSGGIRGDFAVPPHAD